MSNSKGSKPDRSGAARKVDRRKQKKPRPYLVPGERAVLELLQSSPERVKELWIEKGRSLPAVQAKAQALGLALTEVSRDQLAEWTGEGLARGVVAHAAAPYRHPLEELALSRSAPGPAPDPAPASASAPAAPEGSLESNASPAREILVALDGVTDPQNFGAILRNAEFFGARGVLWARDRSAPFSPLAVRASAGASERVELFEVSKLGEALDELKAHHWWIAGTVVDGDPLDWSQWLAEDPPDRIVLVVGNEQKGIRPVIRGRCDVLVTLQRIGEVGSLNVSAATAALLAVFRSLHSATHAAPSDTLKR